VVRRFPITGAGIKRGMGPLQLLAPPAHARVLLTWELTSDQDLRTIRSGILEHFAADPQADPAGNDELAERIGLAATELGGNALRHGLPPITVRMLGDDDCYILDVCDHSPDRTPEPTDGSAQRPLVGGRGLNIVLSLAQRLCWYTTGTSKHVWASFAAPRARPRKP
jgi:serine/threonine-protein kinase RsbW